MTDFRGTTSETIVATFGGFTGGVVQRGVFGGFTGSTGPGGVFGPEVSEWPVIILDTTAPQITWGTVSGTAVGDLLRVEYTIDEAGITDATLELADHTELAVSVYDDHFEVLLPSGISQGVAHLRVTTLDDVGNEAVRSLAVTIGVVPVKPYVPIPGPGRRRVRRQRFEYRFKGRYRVIETSELRFRGRVLVTEPQRFHAHYDVVETAVQRFSATLEISTLLARRREEEELVLLMDYE